MKLELKHLAPYLPYKVRCSTKIEDGSNKNLILTLSGLLNGYARFNHKGDWCNQELDEFKPNLRPLSDLTKEIEVDGEKIIPLIEIAKLTEPDFDWVIIDDIAHYYINPSDYYVFYYDSLLQVFIFELVCNQAESVIAKYPNSQLDCFELAFKYHLDLFKLIPEELAVDINAI